MKEEEIRSKFVLIPLDRIEPNEGQIEGLPANPRDIVDRKFDLLIKSILMHPKMLELRCLMVLPYNDGKFVAIGGNMRHRGLSEIAKMSPSVNAQDMRSCLPMRGNTSENIGRHG